MSDICLLGCGVSMYTKHKLNFRVLRVHHGRDHLRNVIYSAVCVIYRELIVIDKCFTSCSGYFTLGLRHHPAPVGEHGAITYCNTRPWL